jgi:hypothetical protein
MAGGQKRKARQVMITKALLLGYTIEPFETGGYTLKTPAGDTYRLWSNNKKVYDTFPAPWVAAKKALELAGVLSNAKNTR